MPPFHHRHGEHYRLNEHELSTAEEARCEAVKAALQIGAEEVIKGKPFFGAEAIVEHDNQVVERFVVSIGVSPR